MDVRKLNLRWYVLNHNFNANTITKFNIFDSSRFNDCLDNLIKKYSNFEDFKIKLKNDLRYCFWSKAEYEIIAGGLFAREGNDFFKIDVYSQIEPNIDILADYIFEKVNEKKKKKLVK
jgi:hypothetical protein